MDVISFISAVGYVQFASKIAPFSILSFFYFSAIMKFKYFAGFTARPSS